MPGPMTPENNNFSQFRIGSPANLPANEASMRAAINEPKPEWKSESHSLDFKMQNGGGEEDRDPRKDQLEHMLRQEELLEERFGHIRGLIDGLKSLNKDADPSSVERKRERIARSYENVLHSSIDEMNYLNTYLENFRNPYPYDSRYPLQYFEQALAQINEALRNKEDFNEEGLAFLKVAKRDMLWGLSASRINEAMGPAYEMYFDGEMELSRLRTSHTEISSEEFMKTFKKEIYGCRLSENETTLVKGILAKRKGLESKTKDANGNETENLGLREAAVEIQDQFGRLLYQVVGVGQKNLEAVSNPRTLGERPELGESGEHYAELDRVTYQFLSEVFNANSVFEPTQYLVLGDNGEFVKPTVQGEPQKFALYQKSREGAHRSIKYIDKNGVNRPGYDVKNSILNPFCMDLRSDEIAARTYRARMQELIRNNDTYSGVLNKLRTDFESGTIDEAELTKRIQEEADKIFDITDQRVANWENRDENAPMDRLIDTVMRNMTNLEHGSLAGGDLGWGWHYDVVKPPEVNTEAGSNREFIKAPSALGGMIYKDAVDPDTWDLYTKRILFKESKLGRDGNTFYVDGTGRQVNIHETKLTQGEWDDLSPRDKTSRHQAHEYSPDEMAFLSSRIIDTETGRSNLDTGRIQNENGIQFFVRRKSQLGGIYDNHDVTTVAFLARHIVDYDNFADTRSSIFPATIGWYRKLWESEPPYWRPRIENFAPNDHELMKMLGIEGDIGITSKHNILEKQVARKAYLIGVKDKPDQLYGRYDATAAKYVRENTWAFVTPFLERPGDPTSDYLVLPVLIPTQIKDISFWRMVSLNKPSGKLRDTPSQSIWHERLRGKNLSELSWENMDRNKFSWAIVTNDQMERWLGPLVTPHEFNRMTADEVKKHYDMPGGKSEKEAGKRARLGGRGGIWPEGVVRATVFSQNKIIYSMSASNVLNNPLTNIDAGVTSWVSDWVTPWVNEMLDMPSNVRGCTNYSGTAAQTAGVTHLQLEKIIRSIVKTSWEQDINVNHSLGSLKKLYK